MPKSGAGDESRAMIAVRLVAGAAVGHARFSSGWLGQSARLGLSLVSVTSYLRGYQHTMLVILAHVAYLPVQSRAVVLYLSLSFL